MNTTQIDYFLAVAECLNFTKAAQIAYTSQPNISKQIALLEQELGFQLFYRTKQSVVLTQAGIVLHQELKQISRALHEAVEKAADAGKNTKFRVKIGVSTYLDTKIINSAIKRFQEKYPLSTVFIESVDFKTLRAKVIQENYDIAISVAFAFSNLPDLETLPVSEHRMLLVCSKTHPIASKLDVTVADFKDDLFFVLEPTETPKGTELVLDICSKYGFTPKTEMCNSLASYFINLELGNGVAIIDTSLRFPERSVESLVFVNIPEDVAKIQVIAASHNNNNNPAIHLFLAELNDSA